MVGKVGAGVLLAVIHRALEEDGPHSHICSVDLNHKLLRWIWSDQDELLKSCHSL